MTQTQTWFQRFVRDESFSGILLVAMAVIAVVLANTSWSEAYHHLWHLPLRVGSGDASVSLTLHHIINDGLMVIFFLVVGLEIKRELLVGELATVRKATLPVAAAAGGMIAPAVLYLAVNSGTPAISGWAIPTATDIAFALGVLSLLGSRVPIGLKVFLTAFAIVDDLGAVLIIALFYSSSLNLIALGGAGIVLAALWTLNRKGVRNLAAYLVPGILVWLVILLSGIHATIAGVLLALTIPLRPGDTNESATLRKHSPLEALEQRLHPWVAYAIMPIFALANAGVTLGGAVAASHPVSMGVILGLFVGKLVGITVAAYASVRLGVAALPEATTWMHLFGASILGGIGFTMSLFVAGLAFSDPGLIDASKLGILIGSSASGITGYTLLRVFTRPTSA